MYQVEILNRRESCSKLRSIEEGGLQYGCGGVLWDHNGSFIYGFGADLGGCLVLVEELKANWFSLTLAWSRGFWKIHVDSDSQLAVKLLSKGCYMLHQCHALIR